MPRCTLAAVHDSVVQPVAMFRGCKAHARWCSGPRGVRFMEALYFSGPPMTTDARTPAPRWCGAEPDCTGLARSSSGFPKTSRTHSVVRRWYAVYGRLAVQALRSCVSVALPGPRSVEGVSGIHQGQSPRKRRPVLDR